MRHDWNWELGCWRCRYSSLFGDQSWIETQALPHIRILLDRPADSLKGLFKHWRQITCETQIELRESGIEAPRLTSHLYSVVRNRDSSTPPQTRGTKYGFYPCGYGQTGCLPKKAFKQITYDGPVVPLN